MDVTLYRANIGMFYSRAVRMKSTKLSLIKLNLLIPFIIMILHGRKCLHIALFVFLFLSNFEYPCSRKRCYVEVSHSFKKPVKNGFIYLMSVMLVFFLMCTLLLLSGDIHVNPGPSSSLLHESISLMHLNVGSLRKHREALEVEASKNSYDIITLSETWLSGNIANESVHLHGYNQPVRLDRDDGYGGVAIFTKSTIVCKKGLI